MKDHLLGKISSKEARVAVIGQGYVGLPLALEFAKSGFVTLGIDLDQGKISKINRGESYIPDVKSEDLQAMVKKGKLSATNDFSALKKMDAVSICVPTPLRKSKDPDISYIASAVEEIKKNVKKGILIVLESTTYPGTTDEMVRLPLEKMGFRTGSDIFVCFSPERVDPANPVYNTKNTPKVIGGTTPACTELGAALYRACVDHVHAVGSTQEAEMVKLLENTFRAVNIALVNEMLMMCERMNINIWNVIGAAATKPFGFMPFYPGPGIGGHCIPLDPVYLSWKAKAFDFYNRFIELATDINGNMPHYVINRVSKLLNQREKPLKNSKILILGMAYKPNVDDWRESPGVEIFRLLRQEGAVVSYHDPHVNSVDLGEASRVESVDLSEKTLKSHDLAVVVTHHKAIDFDFVVKHAGLVLDTRNALHRQRGPHIFRL